MVLIIFHLRISNNMNRTLTQTSAFSITLGAFPSIMATHELVVPKSIPTS